MICVFYVVFMGLNIPVSFEDNYGLNNKQIGYKGESSWLLTRFQLNVYFILPTGVWS